MRYGRNQSRGERQRKRMIRLPELMAGTYGICWCHGTEVPVRAVGLDRPPPVAGWVAGEWLLARLAMDAPDRPLCARTACGYAIPGGIAYWLRRDERFEHLEGPFCEGCAQLRLIETEDSAGASPAGIAYRAAWPRLGALSDHAGPLVPRWAPTATAPNAPLF